MEAWMMVGLDYMRALRHPCLVSYLQTRDVYPHGSARAILSQPALPRLRSFGRGPPRDPYPQRAPLSLQTLWADLHRDQRHRLLPDAQAEVAGARSHDVAFLRLSGAGYCRRLRPRWAHRRPLAEGIRLSMQAGPRASRRSGEGGASTGAG